MTFKNTYYATENLFKFGGKEWNKTFSDYDFSARYFPTDYARFTTQDPLAENTPNLSPYAYCAGNPMRFVDPTGMDWYENDDKTAMWCNRSEPYFIDKNNAEWRNIGEEYLLFTGSTLYYFTQKKTENGDYSFGVRSFSAVSGRPSKKGEFIYSQEQQAQKNIGPIPEGYYEISPGAIQSYNNLTIHQKALSVLKAGQFPGGRIAWGNNRVWITPKTVNVINPTNGETITRTNLSIHGGKYPGSAGCIDLSNDSDSFFNILRSSNQKSIRLRVRYTNLSPPYFVIQ